MLAASTSVCSTGCFMQIVTINSQYLFTFVCQTAAPGYRTDFANAAVALAANREHFGGELSVPPALSSPLNWRRLLVRHFINNVGA